MILEGTAPADPTAFGEELRRLREQAEVPLDHICSETKISRGLLEALESGNFAKLPERVFSRSFVQQYVACLGEPGGSILAEFDAAWHRFEADSGEFRVDVADPAPARPIRWGFWFPLTVGFAILMSAAVVILSGSDPTQEALVETPRSSSRIESPPATPVGIALPPLVSLPRELDPGEEDPIVLAVRVDPMKECWIHYRDREGRTEQRLLPGGTELQLELKGPVKLTVGNAGAATLVVGGTEYAELGVPGQVVHTEVSRDGVRALGVGDRS